MSSSHDNRRLIYVRDARFVTAKAESRTDTLRWEILVHARRSHERGLSGQFRYAETAGVRFLVVRFLVVRYRWLRNHGDSRAVSATNESALSRCLRHVIKYVQRSCASTGRNWE